MECSTKGDKRFSVFCARVDRRGGKSIEEIYQAAKVFEDGSTGLTWREAKGRVAVNFVARFENLGRDFRHVCDTLGVEDSALPHLLSDVHKNYRDAYSSNSRKIVAEKYADEIELFGYRVISIPFVLAILIISS